MAKGMTLCSGFGVGREQSDVDSILIYQHQGTTKKTDVDDGKFDSLVVVT